MTRHRNLLLISCVVVLALAQASQVRGQRTGRPVAGARTLSPRSVLGFTPGDDRTIADWSQITDYFNRLDRASNRVLVQTVGQSTLKRPMLPVFISSRENILARNKYIQLQLNLPDPR